MAVSPVTTPTAAQKRVLGWLRTKAASDLVNSGATFSTIMAAYLVADGKGAVKEQKYLNAAVTGNDDSNIIIGLEKVTALEVLSATSGDISGAATDTSQIVLAGVHGRDVTYGTISAATATVSSSGLVTLNASGTTFITVSVEENDDYSAESIVVMVEVA